MKHKFKLPMLVLVSVLIVNCAKKDEEKKSESHKYSIEVNGCKTGEKSFSSKSDYCNTLLNDVANNYCGRKMREEIYARDCASGLVVDGEQEVYQ